MSPTRFSVSLDESLMRGIIWHKAHGRWAHPRFTCLGTGFRFNQIIGKWL